VISGADRPGMLLFCFITVAQAQQGLGPLQSLASARSGGATACSLMALRPWPPLVGPLLGVAGAGFALGGPDNLGRRRS
jgi:hypothetical protein